MTDLASNLVEVEGVWFTDEAVVQATADGVKAYDKESGKQLWATGLPGSGNVPCLAPAESYGGIGVVAYRAWMPDGSPGICDRVAAYDLGSGKELWHKRFKVEDELDTTELSVARAGDVVIVRTELEHAALKASDGSVAWDVRAAVTKDCGEGRYTGGENLIRLRRCGVGDPFEDGRGWDEISLIDPTTGKAEWTRRVEKEGAELVVSSAPIVVESGERDWYPLDEKDGKVGHEFDGSPDSYASSLDDQGSPWRRMTRVGDIFVIAGGHPGDGPDSPGGGRQSMAAYDLNTGEQLWKSDPEQVIDFYPVGAGDAGKLLAYKTDGHEQPELVEVDARSGDETTVLRYPEELAERTGALPGVFRDGDQVYVASIEVGGVSGSYGLAALPTKEQ
ncbi:outer membrane protein assembly factor BamB family protein [Streptomyces sp. NPDC002851]